MRKALLTALALMFLVAAGVAGTQQATTAVTSVDTFTDEPIFPPPPPPPPKP
jgi:hypothetical protein